MTRSPKQEGDSTERKFDDVLKRMLSTPPKPHKEDKAKPAEKTAKNKPAK